MLDTRVQPLLHNVLYRLAVSPGGTIRAPIIDGRLDPNAGEEQDRSCSSLSEHAVGRGAVEPEWSSIIDPS